MTTSSLIINTQLGSVEGCIDHDTRVWFGIPYARPPIGAYRWMPPEPLTCNDEKNTVFHAETAGFCCFQIPPPHGPESTIQASDMSEDCLNLNIWAPLEPQDNLLPVMVWLHGGAFRLGCATLPLYNGAALAKKNTVVVSINYRLGPLSIFIHPKLQAEHASAGINLGLLDQIAALQWIQANIQSFGGDPQNITLWGESAGGASVGYLMQSPQAQGLFHKAIIQSGALDLPEESLDTVQKVFHEAMPAAFHMLSADELRTLSPQQLLALPLPRTATMPLLDGNVLHAPLLEGIRQSHPNIPVLIGSNDYEAGFFPPAWSMSMQDKLGSLWLAAQQLTDISLLPNEQQAAQLAGDKFVTLPTREMADCLADTGHCVWRYLFSYVAPEQRANTLGAIHTAEIPYVFGTHHSDHAEVQCLSNRLMDYWVQFARTGRPNPPDQSNWPLWNTDKKLLNFHSSGASVEPEPHEASLIFLKNQATFKMN